MKDLALDPAVIAVMHIFEVNEFLIFLRKRLTSKNERTIKLARDENGLLWKECISYQRGWENEIKGLTPSPRFMYIHELLNQRLILTTRRLQRLSSRIMKMARLILAR
jgi:hypothetical protein